MGSGIYIPLNALGLLCAAGYSGYATTASHTPWGGFVATVLFFIAACAPIVREYRNLKVGFRSIEESYLENRRREHSPLDQEVIGFPDTQKFTPQRKVSNKVLLALTLLAFSLLVSDLIYRQTHLPEKPPISDQISNF